MNVGIIGYGYIGAVCSAALLLKKHNLLILDKNIDQTSGIFQKKFTFPEKDVEEIVNKNFDNIKVVNGYYEFGQADVIVVCVNTSLQKNGRLDYTNITNVLENLSLEEFKGKVIIRSTLPLDEELLETLHRNYCFQLFVLPEFLREGSALADLVGSTNAVIGYQNRSQMPDEVVKLFSFEKTKVHAMPIKDAIFTKLLNNTWHAMKVAFANEWDAIAKDNGISDTSKIYQAFIADTHLNISEKYLRPGGPFGGPCLPKDISEFISLAKTTPSSICSAVVESNQHIIERLSGRIEKHLSEQNEKKFYFDTIEFKKGTADERFSPAHKVISILSERGFSYEASANIIFSGRSLLDDGELRKVDEAK